MEQPSRIVVLLAIGSVLLAVFGGVVYAMHLSNTVGTDGDIPLVASDGMEVHVVGDTQQFMEQNFPTSGTVSVVTEEGNATLFSSGDANATLQVSEIEGQWTNATNVQADPNPVTVDPGDKPSFIVTQEIDSVSVYETVDVDDGTVDFVYDSQGGPGEMTLQSLPGNQQLVAVDASSGTFLDTATSTGAGAVTFDALDSGTHNVEIRTGSFEDPELSNPSPTGDLTSEPNQISVDVNDPEFDQGDSVDVSIDLDGSQIHSETITANQTVSTSMPSSGQLGGAHEWTVEADPDFGDPTSQSYDYRVPANLTIRSERDHTEIIDSPIQSNVTFFGDDRIVTRNTDSGVIDLSGLPVNQDFIAEVVPSDDNWTSRTTYFQSIYQQQSIYLLNTSAVDTIESRFILDDPTGEYGSETIFYIQRPINISGETTWQTVHADAFGVEGVTATLEESQRYRVRIQNPESGSSQIVGPYRATVGETVQVQPGAPGIDMGDFEDGIQYSAVLNNQTLTYAYNDPDVETDQLTVWIHEKGDQSNRLVSNTSYFDVGEVSAQESLTQNESEQTWVVNFVIDRNGEEFTKTVETSNRRNLFGAVPQPWQAMIGIGLLLLLAGAFSQLNAAVGAVVVAVVGGILYFIGLLSGMTTGIGVSLAIFVAVINQIRLGRGT